MSKTSSSVTDLLKNAHKEGDLSMASMQVLTGAIDIGAQIQAGLGVAAEDVQAAEVVLVTMLIDDSGSIRFAQNAQLVRDGHNLVLASLVGTKQKDSLLVHTRYLNGDVLFPYVKIDDAKKMDAQNYNPNGGTPLYDQTVVILGTVLAKTKEFEDCGVPCRSITAIITDGNDEGSRGSARDARAIVEDMLKREKHIIAAMGIDDGRTDFHQVFDAMGVRKEWILTPGNNEKEIRKAFQVFSQSAVRASQGAASFSQAAMGGFGTP